MLNDNGDRCSLGTVVGGRTHADIERPDPRRFGRRTDRLRVVIDRRRPSSFSSGMPQACVIDGDDPDLDHDRDQ